MVMRNEAVPVLLTVEPDGCEENRANALLIADDGDSASDKVRLNDRESGNERGDSAVASLVLPIINFDGARANETVDMWGLIATHRFVSPRKGGVGFVAGQPELDLLGGFSTFGSGDGLGALLIAGRERQGIEKLVAPEGRPQSPVEQIELPFEK